MFQTISQLLQTPLHAILALLLLHPLLLPIITIIILVIVISDNYNFKNYAVYLKDQKVIKFKLVR